MSSAGQIFSDEMITLQSDVAGNKDYFITLDNDGLILYFKKLSNSQDLTLHIYNELGGLGSDLIQKVNVSQNRLTRLAIVAHRRIRINVSWNSSVDLRMAIKNCSAKSVELFNKQFIEPDTSTKEWQEQLLCRVESIHDVQQKILNNIREITDLNNDEGEDFDY